MKFHIKSLYILKYPLIDLETQKIMPSINSIRRHMLIISKKCNWHVQSNIGTDSLFWKQARAVVLFLKKKFTNVFLKFAIEKNTLKLNKKNK